MHTAQILAPLWGNIGVLADEGKCLQSLVASGMSAFAGGGADDGDTKRCHAFVFVVRH